MTGFANVIVTDYCCCTGTVCMCWPQRQLTGPTITIYRAAYGDIDIFTTNIAIEMPQPRKRERLPLPPFQMHDLRIGRYGPPKSRKGQPSFQRRGCY